MKLTPWMLAILAFLVIAALAVGFFVKRLFAKEPPQAVVDPRERIPVALSEIEPGTVIDASFLADAPIRREVVEEHRDTVKSREALIGRIAKERIPMAQPLRLSMFYPIGQGPPIEVTPGHRLVNVKLSDTGSQLTSLIRKGNYVDVMMTVDNARTNSVQRGGDSMTLQLFDGVKVFEMPGNRGNSRNVVLELTPDQQRIMVLAEDKGRINLTYNPQGPGNGGVSVQASKEDRIRLSEILGYEEAAPEDAPEPFVTEQYRNGGRQDAFYDDDGNRTGPPQGRNGANGYQGGYNGTGGVPLQGSGGGFGAGGGNWSTSTDDPAQANDQVAQQNSNVSQ